MYSLADIPKLSRLWTVYTPNQEVSNFVQHYYFWCYCNIFYFIQGFSYWDPACPGNLLQELPSCHSVFLESGIEKATSQLHLTSWHECWLHFYGAMQRTFHLLLYCVVERIVMFLLLQTFISELMPLLTHTSLDPMSPPFSFPVLHLILEDFSTPLLSQCPASLHSLQSAANIFCLSSITQKPYMFADTVLLF